MIVDASALVAVFVQEPGYEALLERLEQAEAPGIGTPTLTEVGALLIERLRGSAIGPVARFVQELGIVVVPFGDEHWKEAIDAYERYGRGRHAASLTFAQCMTYAVAKLAREPLLFRNAGFSKTDLSIA